MQITATFTYSNAFQIQTMSVFDRNDENKIPVDGVNGPTLSPNHSKCEDFLRCVAKFEYLNWLFCNLLKCNHSCSLLQQLSLTPSFGFFFDKNPHYTSNVSETLQIHPV